MRRLAPIATTPAEYGRAHNAVATQRCPGWRPVQKASKAAELQGRARSVQRQLANQIRWYDPDAGEPGAGKAWHSRDAWLLYSVVALAIWDYLCPPKRSKGKWSEENQDRQASAEAFLFEEGLETYGELLGFSPAWVRVLIKSHVRVLPCSKIWQ